MKGFKGGVLFRGNREADWVNIKVGVKVIGILLR